MISRLRPWAFPAIIALLALGPTATAYSLTLSEIRTQIRQAVHDTGETGRQSYTDATLLTWINDAQREVVNLTWCVQKSTSYALSAATTFYSLPSDFIAIVNGKALFEDSGGQKYQLQEYSEQKILQTEPDFENTSTGSPSHYFIKYPDDTDEDLEISYLPVPTSADIGTVSISYYYQPPDLSSDSDIPFDSFNSLLPYNYAIVYHVVAKIKALEQKTEQSTFYQAQFTNAVTIMADRLGRAPNRSPSAQGATR